MQATRTVNRLRRAATVVATLSLVVATALDGAGHLLGAAPPPSRLAAATYALLAAGIAAGCLAVLLRLLGEPALRPLPGRRRTALLELAAIGVLLGSLVLRGHAEIPPDAPLIGAQLLALAGLAVAEWTRRRIGRAGAAADPHGRAPA